MGKVDSSNVFDAKDCEGFDDFGDLLRKLSSWD